MSYYEQHPWQVPGRQHSWEQPPPPSRSGTTSTVQRDDSSAFSCQIDEVERAIENLVKSGKMFGGVSSRRESMPVIGVPRAFPEYDPRMGGGMPQRHHSVSEYDPMRSHSASNLQNFYASQRYQSRPSEAEQMMQAKRRMAAQRERELRNYHQEQQYNRTLLADISTQGKSDRSNSPSTMSEESRREMIARQQRAFYAGEPAPYYDNGAFGDDSHTPRPGTQGSGNPSSAASGLRGPSPLAFDPFGMSQKPGQSGSGEGSGQQSNGEQVQGQQATGTGPSPIQPQQRSRANSTSSPSSNANGFSLFENAAQQSSRTSTSSPGGSPPRQLLKSTTTPAGSGVAPIGTRPNQTSQGQATNPALNKRSTTPLPSPLSYGFAANDNANAAERTTSASSNPPTATSNADVGLGWGSNNGVWGAKNSLSVWG
ncbi:MAG: hypothetical protein M1812_003392 [Candelaria pacifica]|nr:MAG: hypothetical protein M1812_003392 [Candelaria pacifica]